MAGRKKKTESEPVNAAVTAPPTAVEAAPLPEPVTVVQAVPLKQPEGKKKENKCNVIWFDDREWDISHKIRESKIPPLSRLYDFDGQWFYILQRYTNEDGTHGFNPFPVLGTGADEVTPAELGSATAWEDLSSFMSADPPNYEKLEKVFLVSFIIGGFIFLFLLILVLLGGE